MKVVCIDNLTLSGKKIKGLTLGKIYDCINLEGYTTSPVTYRIIDDNGFTNWYHDEVLIPIEKYRELKLNELGI